MERSYFGKFVVFHGDELVGGFDTLDEAAEEAITRYGRGPYLIRRVGEKPDLTAATHLAHLAARPDGAKH